MPQRVDLFDLETLQLRPGDGRASTPSVRVDAAAARRRALPRRGGAVDGPRSTSPARSSGYALRLRFDAPLEGAVHALHGPRAARSIAVDAREVEQPGEDEELHSPYLDGGVLDLADWARDALVLAMPAQIVCSEDCRGLCPECGANLNEVDPEEHRHEAAGDPRWAKLRELKLG